MSGTNSREDQDNSPSMPIMAGGVSTSQEGAATGSPEENPGSSNRGPAILESPQGQDGAKAGPSTRPDSPDAIQPAPDSSASKSSSLISIQDAPFLSNSVGQRVWNVWESGLKRVGLCLYTVVLNYSPTYFCRDTILVSKLAMHRCMRFNVICTVCEEKRLAEERAKAAEQKEVAPVDLAAKAAEGQPESVNVRFYFARRLDLEIEKSYPLTINRGMTAYQVIKALAGVTSAPDGFSYSLAEHWIGYEAHRYLDDCESMYINEWEHVASKQSFRYVFQKNEEKFDYTRHRKLYFITPEKAREKFATSSNVDPDLIQVRHEFFQHSTGIFHTARKDSRKKKVLKYFRSLGRSTSSDSEERSARDASKTLLDRDDSAPEPEIPKGDKANPIYCSTVYVKETMPDCRIDELRRWSEKIKKSKWPKKYLLLRNKTLYFVKDHSHMMKYYLMENEQFALVALSSAIILPKTSEDFLAKGPKKFRNFKFTALFSSAANPRKLLFFLAPLLHAVETGIGDLPG
ncbi:hypothetical protein HUJ05_005334 [Dendroctonus ponderosae]|nr:hypothetical protein HUJ05_005334 [Dendroctonus ponderosae]